jgi:periplasmic divalent cation tolerance protein
MAEPFIDVWINCPDRPTAERIATAVIEQRLAACANILAPVASLYHWKGSVERAEEIPLVLKSRAALFEDLCATVRGMHPYELPSIVAMELSLVDTGYARWLSDETRER